jgi:hypothetical protein
MTFDVNVFVLIGQLLVSGLLVWVALRKAPAEKQSFDATSIARYAEAAKLKAEENERLETELEEIRNRLTTVERKKYRIISEFTIGDPPEMGKVLIEPIIPEIIPDNKLASSKSKKNNQPNRF